MKEEVLFCDFCHELMSASGTLGRIGMKFGDTECRIAGPPARMVLESVEDEAIEPARWARVRVDICTECMQAYVERTAQEMRGGCARTD